MSDTPRHGLPRLEEGQAAAEVVHNEALNRIDFLMNCSVKGFMVNAPPSSPANGDCYMLSSSPTGVWAGHPGQIACYNSGWVFYTPKAGFLLWDVTGTRLLVLPSNDPLADWGTVPFEI